jgi:hypothetical protein
MIDTLELIAKLLAKAEGATTEAEAATYNEKAQQIATSYSLDIAKARHVNRNKQATKPEQRSIVIGVRGTEGLKTLINLYLGIAAANDLRCLIGSNRVYAIGFPEDIDITGALYASLVTQMTGFVEDYRLEGTWKSEEVFTEVWKNGYSDGGQYRKINWRTARLNFQNGFAGRIASRLLEARAEEQRRRIAEEDRAQILDDGVAADEAPPSDEPGTELVLADKREQVREFYDSVPKGRGGWNGGASTHAGGSSRAGASAANRARLGSGTPLGGARKGIR